MAINANLSEAQPATFFSQIGQFVANTTSALVSPYIQISGVRLLFPMSQVLQFCQFIKMPCGQVPPFFPTVSPPPPPTSSPGSKSSTVDPASSPDSAVAPVGPTPIGSFRPSPAPEAAVNPARAPAFAAADPPESLTRNLASSSSGASAPAPGTPNPGLKEPLPDPEQIALSLVPNLDINPGPEFAPLLGVFDPSKNPLAQVRSFDLASSRAEDAVHRHFA